MNTYEVSLDSDVDFAPSDEILEVLQNVRTIIATRRGTVPLDRDLGISWSFVDRPITEAQMQMRAELIDASEQQEPRARVVRISFDASEEEAREGSLRPTVVVSINLENS